MDGNTHTVKGVRPQGKGGADLSRGLSWQNQIVKSSQGFIRYLANRFPSFWLIQWCRIFKQCQMQSPIITWWLCPAVSILCFFLCGQGSLCFLCTWTSIMSNHAAQLKVKFRPHFYWLIMIIEEVQNEAFDLIFDTSSACSCASSCFGTFIKCSHGGDETLVSERIGTRETFAYHPKMFHLLCTVLL